MALNKYNTIILDCDGVVFDSNFLKIEAFKETFRELGFENRYIIEFEEFMKKNFGISRYKFVEYFIITILKQTYDKIIFDKIIETYSKKSFNLYLNANFTNNLLDFLENYKNKKLFIASGSKENELIEIFGIRGISKYFRSIYGSPKSKSNILKSIVALDTNAIMIGDAKSDMLAASNNNIDFIFMKQYSTNKNLEKDYNLKTINNLGELI